MQLKDTRQICFTKTPQPVYAALNKERFNRVIDNLVSNAVKFTPQNGQINLELFPQNGQLQLQISDNGIGIPQNLQPFLFERFTKARRTGLQGEESTGLGLSITQQLVQKHGGSIVVKSSEKQGTAFQITLPTCVKDNKN
jgi:signal transduction histidine kinase